MGSEPTIILNALFKPIPDRRNPRLALHVVIDVFRLGLDLREDLDPTRPAADEGDGLVCPVERRIPSSRVKDRAFERPQTLDVRPLPAVQDPGALKEDVGRVGDGLYRVRGRPRQE